ncbi:bifunctional 4-hydroxy-2-oxoglutarate aldolase/2-dehydro-3-deoxy-phosphogluconate aldolase [Janibacter sp. HTCC2649]|uniref:bifunctional 4-hydroxy-2-oxoglutarate aldolase/2-dehydro-3-deoxy-phosphogluconate aldolase n=1 Tax=Janibacter sp. HTCC2649 TaxID=313589 RepID=UPI0002F9B86A|nr:bifunctional 4-hydroxy-2-oxoglutarate aldolase/2-dehydro-3-deoxy-phosphogluconate aldolase [Janibacter sp. HTCC2649]
MQPGQLPALVRAHRIMAIIRGTSQEAALDTGRVLIEEGIRLVEITLTTPGALATIEALRALTPEGSFVGAGTVLTEDDVAAAQSAGAEFVVTPAVTPSVAEAARRGMPCAAGAFTASEAYLAFTAGAELIKLFPASTGGPAYLKALRDPFPQIPFMAVGGVGISEARAYLTAGAIGAGVGGPLVGDAANGGSLDALRHRARAFASWAGDAGESS